VTGPRSAGYEDVVGPFGADIEGHFFGHEVHWLWPFLGLALENAGLKPISELNCLSVCGPAADVAPAAAAITRQDTDELFPWLIGDKQQNHHTTHAHGSSSSSATTQTEAATTQKPPAFLSDLSVCSNSSSSSSSNCCSGCSCSCSCIPQ